MSQILLSGESLDEDFHDIELELVRWTLARLGPVESNVFSLVVTNSGNRTPADLEMKLPFVRWAKTGGTEDAVTDYPVVDFDVFAAARSEAYLVARAIVNRLQPRTRLSPGGAIIDSVRVRPTPRELPWDNPKLKRIGATCSLGLRR